MSERPQASEVKEALEYADKYYSMSFLKVLAAELQAMRSRAEKAEASLAGAIYERDNVFEQLAQSQAQNRLRAKLDSEIHPINRCIEFDGSRHCYRCGMTWHQRNGVWQDAPKECIEQLTDKQRAVKAEKERDELAARSLTVGGKK